MCLRKNKKIQYQESREVIDLNYKSIQVLIALCQDEQNKEKLKDLMSKMQYLKPSSSEKVYKQDIKIKNVIEDAKITFIKKKKQESDIVDENITELNVLIAERNIYI